MNKHLMDSGAILRLESAIINAIDNGGISVSIGLTDARSILKALTLAPTPPQDFRQKCVEFVNARRVLPLFPAD